MADYDVRKAFERIENELIASMIRNMEKHREWEDDEGFHWEQWQALQLKNLSEYKKRNQQIFGKKFKIINIHIEEAIMKARKDGNMQQELELLKMAKTGRIKKPKLTQNMAETNAEFFRVNDRKMEALIKATVSDMEKAETAILRMANDKYRKVIFDAQVYANSGAGTYEKAVDMATRDFLAAGLNCVEYKNGARHTLKDYADMALRTASKRAYLTGEGEKRKEWGISTVIVTKRGNPCPLCLPFVGKVMIDDVWSGGPKNGISPETGKKYLLMSEAVSAGLYHPRCQDDHSTFFEGLNEKPDDKFTKEEIKDIEEVNKVEAKKQYAQRQAEKYERLAHYCLESDNKKKYTSMAEQWKRKKSLDTEDFLIEAYDNSKDISSEKDVLFKVLSVLPDLVVDAARGKTKFIVGQFDSCKYDIKNDIIHIAFNAEPYMVIHEFGHMTEKKLLDDDKAKNIKESAFKDVTLWNLRKDVFLDMKKNKHFRTIVKSSRLVSDYQGVILIDNIEDCFDSDMNLIVDAMTEYFSEGFRAFVLEPDLLRKKDPELFDVFMEVVNEKD